MPALERSTLDGKVLSMSSVPPPPSKLLETAFALSDEARMARSLRIRANEFESILDVARSMLQQQPPSSHLLARANDDFMVFVRPNEPRRLRINIGLSVFLDMGVSEAVEHCSATARRLQDEADSVEELWAQKFAVVRAREHVQYWDSMAKNGL